MSLELARYLTSYAARLRAMSPAELEAEDARHDALGYAAARARLGGDSTEPVAPADDRPAFDPGPITLCACGMRVPERAMERHLELARSGSKYSMHLLLGGRVDVVSDRRTA